MPDGDSALKTAPEKPPESRTRWKKAEDFGKKIMEKGARALHPGEKVPLATRAQAKNFLADAARQGSEFLEAFGKQLVALFSGGEITSKTFLDLVEHGNVLAYIIGENNVGVLDDYANGITLSKRQEAALKAIKAEIGEDGLALMVKIRQGQRLEPVDERYLSFLFERAKEKSLISVFNGKDLDIIDKEITGQALSKAENSRLAKLKDDIGGEEFFDVIKQIRLQQPLNEAQERNLLKLYTKYKIPVTPDNLISVEDYRIIEKIEGKLGYTPRELERLMRVFKNNEEFQMFLIRALGKIKSEQDLTKMGYDLLSRGLITEKLFEEALGHRTVTTAIDRIANMVPAGMRAEFKRKLELAIRAGTTDELIKENLGKLNELESLKGVERELRKIAAQLQNAEDRTASISLAEFDKAYRKFYAELPAEIKGLRGVVKTPEEALHELNEEVDLLKMQIRPELARPKKVTELTEKARQDYVKETEKLATKFAKGINADKALEAIEAEDPVSMEILRGLKGANDLILQLEHGKLATKRLKLLKSAKIILVGDRELDIPGFYGRHSKSIKGLAAIAVIWAIWHYQPWISPSDQQKQDKQEEIARNKDAVILSRDITRNAVYILLNPDNQAYLYGKWSRRFESEKSSDTPDEFSIAEGLLTRPNFIKLARDYENASDPANYHNPHIKDILNAQFTDSRGRIDTDPGFRLAILSEGERKKESLKSGTTEQPAALSLADYDSGQATDIAKSKIHVHIPGRIPIDETVFRSAGLGDEYITGRYKAVFEWYNMAVASALKDDPNSKKLQGQQQSTQDIAYDAVQKRKTSEILSKYITPEELGTLKLAMYNNENGLPLTDAQQQQLDSLEGRFGKYPGLIHLIKDLIMNEKPMNDAQASELSELYKSAIKQERKEQFSKMRPADVEKELESALGNLDKKYMDEVKDEGKGNPYLAYDYIKKGLSGIQAGFRAKPGSVEGTLEDMESQMKLLAAQLEGKAPPEGLKTAKPKSSIMQDIYEQTGMPEQRLKYMGQANPAVKPIERPATVTPVRVQQEDWTKNPLAYTDPAGHSARHRQKIESQNAANIKLVQEWITPGLEAQFLNELKKTGLTPGVVLKNNDPIAAMQRDMLKKANPKFFKK